MTTKKTASKALKPFFKAIDTGSINQPTQQQYPDRGVQFSGYSQEKKSNSIQLREQFRKTKLLNIGQTGTNDTQRDNYDTHDFYVDGIILWLTDPTNAGGQALVVINDYTTSAREVLRFVIQSQNTEPCIQQLNFTTPLKFTEKYFRISNLGGSFTTGRYATFLGWEEKK